MAESIKISKTSSLFENKRNEVAGKLGISPETLTGIFRAEGTINNPNAVNRSTGYSGLIQFSPESAKRSGTSLRALRRMDAVAQMDYVHNYLGRYKHDKDKPADSYLSVAYPAAMYKPDDYILGKGKRIGIIARQNPGWDRDKNGVVTAGEVREYYYTKNPNQRPKKDIQFLQPDINIKQDNLGFTNPNYGKINHDVLSQLYSTRSNIDEETFRRLFNMD